MFVKFAFVQLRARQGLAPLIESVHFDNGETRRVIHAAHDRGVTRIIRRQGRARDKWLERQGHLLTSDYVIDETFTLLRVRLGLTAAENWWHTIAASSRVRKEAIHGERAERARGVFFRYRNFRSLIAPALP